MSDEHQPHQRHTSQRILACYFQIIGRQESVDFSYNSRHASSRHHISTLIIHVGAPMALGCHHRLVVYGMSLRHPVTRPCTSTRRIIDDVACPRTLAPHGCTDQSICVTALHIGVHATYSQPVSVVAQHTVPSTQATPANALLHLI